MFKLVSRIALAAAAAAVVGLATSMAPVGAANAAPAAMGAVEKDLTRNCAVFLDRLPSGRTVVEAQECAVGKQPTIAASATHLMTWYQKKYYEGASVRIYGFDGPCDSVGYRIADVSDVRWGGSWWNDRISSFKSYNRCTGTWYYQHRNFAGEYCFSGDSPYNIGCGLDNRISSMETFRD